jgi:hypothetical protein
MNTRTKLVTLTLAGLATLSSAAVLLGFSGSLPPNTHRDHYFDVGDACYSVELTNLNFGDLDAQVFDEDGWLLDEDTLTDNHPMLDFCSDKSQTIRVRVINASGSRTANYRGTIDP